MPSLEAAFAIFSSAILSMTFLMRWVASLRKKGFSTYSSTGSWVERRSLMSVLVASRMTATLEVEGRLLSFSINWCPSMPGMR